MRPVAGNLRSTLRRRRALLVAGTCLVVCFAVYVGRNIWLNRSFPPGHWIDVLAFVGSAAAAFVLLVLAWLDLRRDATALARALESEAHLLLLTSQAPANVWTTDAELRLTSVFGALITELNNPSAQVPGSTLYDLFETRDEQHPAIAAHLRALKGESATYERKVGDRFLEGRVEPLRDDQARVIGCVGTAMDVSTWRWAESQVHRYAALVQSSEDAIISTDLDGMIETWNPAAERLYGYPAAEMLGRPISVLEPEEQAGEAAAMRERLVRGEPPVAYETVRRRRDGTILEIATHLSPMRDAEGRLTGVSAVVRDITDRKRAQAALRESDALLNAVGEMARVGGWEIDVATRKVRWTRETYAIHEVPVGQDIALADAILFFDLPDRATLESALRRCMEEGEPFDLELPFTSARGTHLWTHAIGRAIRVDGVISKLTGTFQDITERKLADESRKNAEENYRVLAENSPDLITRFDARLRHLYVNPAAARAGKLSASEHVGLTTAESGVAEPFATKRNERLDQVLKTGTMLDVEDVLPTPEGIRYLHTRITPELAPDGSVRSVLSFARDITERKRAEEEMARIASFPQMDPMPIAEVDAAGKITFMNPVAERLFAELRNVSPHHPFVADAWTLIDERQGLGTGPRSREVQVGARWYLQDMYVLPDRSHVRIYATDITERKQAEEALRQSETMFRLLTENATDIISRHAPDGTFLYVSPACRKLLGYDAEELVGRSPFEFIHPDDATVTTPPSAGFDLPKRYAVTFRFRRKDGTYGWFESFGHTEHDQTTGAVTEIHAVSRDVTDRLQAEGRLRLREEEFRALARHLDSVREEEQTRMAREIHDELAQSLTALRLDLSWLSRKTPDAGSGVRAKIAEMVALTEATIEAGRRIAAELRPPILDDLGLVAALEWFVQDFAKRTKLRATFKVRPMEPALDGSLAVTAYRIVQEALSNVARHAEAKRVTVRLGERDGTLLLEITDDGRGMRGAPSGGARSFGIIGMRERAAARGGELEVANAPRGGTVVRATFPLGSRRKPREHG